MCEMPVAAETSRNLQQTRACCVLSWGSWPQIMGPSAVTGHAGSQEAWGSDLHLLTGLSVAAWVVRARLWGLRWQPQLTPTPVAPVGGVLLAVTAQRNKFLWQDRPSLHTPQQWSLVSQVGPGFFLDSLSCGMLHPRPLRLCSHSQPPLSPWGLTSEAQASVPSPTCPCG